MDKTFIENMPLAAPGLAISGGSASPTPAVGNTVQVKIDGSVYPAVAAVDLPALTAYTLAKSQVIALAVLLNKAGTYSYAASPVFSVPQIDALGNTITFPTGSFPAGGPGLAKIGYIIIATDSSTTFTGGTDNLDASGITTIFIDNFNFDGK